MKTWKKVAFSVVLAVGALLGAFALSALPVRLADPAHLAGWLVAFGAGLALCWCSAGARGVAMIALARAATWLLGLECGVVAVLAVAAMASQVGSRKRAWTAAGVLAVALLSVHAIDHARPIVGRTAGSGEAVAILGDSSAYGMFVAAPDSFAARLSRHARVTNAAWPGARSSDLAEQWSSVEASHPSIVVVLVGPNDRGRDGWALATERNLERFAVRARDSRVIFLSYPLGSIEQPRWIADLDEATRSAASESGADVIDVRGALGRDPRNFIADELHPSARGHEVVADLLLHALAHAVLLV